MSNITQVVNANKNTTTLKKGIIASGLDKFLSGTGPWTVFAPSDLAFTKLEKGRFENMLKPDNLTELEQVLNGHIVAGKISYKDLKDGEKLTTVNGVELLIQVKENRVSVAGSKIENRDVPTSNGVIHFLDTVVLKN